MKPIQTALLSLLLSLGLCGVAMACLSGEAIRHNRETAQMWGDIGLVLSVVPLGLQIWRRGFCAATIVLLSFLTVIHLINPGLHYYGLKGDCGMGDVSGAKTMAGVMGFLLFYQVAALFWRAWLHKKQVAR